MAKFNISYDSESKELSVQLNGQELQNVSDVSAYKDGEYSHICVGMREVKDKVYYYNRVEASKSEHGKKAILDGTGLLINDYVLILKE